MMPENSATTTTEFSMRKGFFLIYHNVKLVLKLVCLDQVTKWWFINFLKNKPYLTYKVASFLDMVYVWNFGISFGLFSHQYSNYIFIILNTIITIYLWYLLLRCTHKLEFIGYSLIIGGAIGNLVDRIFHRAVFDFIYLHYEQYGFFVFNLADSFISIGALYIIYFYYLEKKEKRVIKAEEDEYYEVLHSEAEKIRTLDDANKNME